MCEHPCGTYLANGNRINEYLIRQRLQVRAHLEEVIDDPLIDPVIPFGHRPRNGLILDRHHMTRRWLEELSILYTLCVQVQRFT